MHTLGEITKTWDSAAVISSDQPSPMAASQSLWQYMHRPCTQGQHKLWLRTAADTAADIPPPAPRQPTHTHISSQTRALGLRLQHLGPLHEQRGEDAGKVAGQHAIQGGFRVQQAAQVLQVAVALQHRIDQGVDLAAEHLAGHEGELELLAGAPLCARSWREPSEA